MIIELQLISIIEEWNNILCSNKILPPKMPMHYIHKRKRKKKKKMCHHNKKSIYPYLPRNEYDELQQLGHKPSYGESGVRQTHSLMSLAITLCHNKQSAWKEIWHMNENFGKETDLRVEFVAFGCMGKIKVYCLQFRKKQVTKITLHLCIWLQQLFKSC